MDDTGTFLHSVEGLRLHVDRRLAELIPAPEQEPGRLGEAAHYALLAPGKRFRPLLTLLAAEAFGAPVTKALDVACAMEMVHAASLVLDDLSSNAGLYNSAGTTQCAAPLGSPFVSLAGPLAPGASTTAVLQFTDPKKTGISYTTRVLAGGVTQ